MRSAKRLHDRGRGVFSSRLERANYGEILRARLQVRLRWISPDLCADLRAVLPRDRMDEGSAKSRNQTLAILWYEDSVKTLDGLGFAVPPIAA